VYPDGIAVDVSPERLARFFVQQEDGTFRINREIREMVVFAEQSVTRDPPFSRLDFVSCRNLLIYLNERLQEQVLRLFHYSLRPEGFLFLGSSESRGRLEELFEAVDKKWKIFRRVGEQGASHPHPPLVDRDQYAPQAGLAPARGQPGADRSAPFEGADQRLFQQMLLAHHTPAAVVVDEEGRVLYLHGLTEQYLKPPMGAVPFDLVTMVRQGLLPELRTGLRRATASKNGWYRRAYRSTKRTRPGGSS
jgi:two-component system CheB/CheR fusion protein